MPTLVEIGPSNASQGQYIRKDATEQIKKSDTRYIYIYVHMYAYTYIRIHIYICAHTHIYQYPDQENNVSTVKEDPPRDKNLQQG